MGPYASDVRNVGVTARREARHRHTTTYLHARLRRCRPGDNLLERCPAGGECDEAIIVGTALESSKGGGRRFQRVEAERAGGHEGIADVRQLGVQDVAGPGMEVVQLPELRDATPRPALPGLVGDSGRSGVAPRLVTVTVAARAFRWRARTPAAVL
jgi:hypothetical protein